MDSKRLAQPRLCLLSRVVCVYIQACIYYIFEMNRLAQHLCNLVWTVTNQTKWVLSLFHPLFVPSLGSK